jgi:Domain of unknown function (DUF1772)
MLNLLQIVAVILAAVALVPAMAHALELPGKMRLEKDRYFAVQTIYYPGFTVAGFAEPLAVIATFGLLVMTRQGGVAFWLTLAALIGLVVVQIVYWIFVHPVNKLWLQGERLGHAGSGFFSFASPTNVGVQDWKRSRNRWEYAHVARAALAAVSFVALVVAIVMAPD